METYKNRILPESYTKYDCSTNLNQLKKLLMKVSLRLSKVNNLTAKVSVIVVYLFYCTLPLV